MTNDFYTDGLIPADLPETELGALSSSVSPDGIRKRTVLGLDSVLFIHPEIEAGTCSHTYSPGICEAGAGPTQVERGL